MDGERKSTMVSARLRTSLVERIDYVVANTDGTATNRTSAVREALEGWLPEQERRIEQRLGTSAAKKPR